MPRLHVKPLITAIKAIPSSLVPLFQNEALCKTFDMKMSLFCMKMNL